MATPLAEVQQALADVKAEIEAERSATISLLSIAPTWRNGNPPDALIVEFGHGEMTHSLKMIFPEKGEPASGVASRLRYWAAQIDHLTILETPSTGVEEAKQQLKESHAS